MTSPNLDPQVRLLAGQLAQLQKRIFQLERNQRASAGPASIAAGGLTVTDPGGVPQVVVGQQSDGSYGVQSVTPQVPVAPDQPLAGPGILGIWVYWDGQMSDGSNPLLDLNSVQVHCSAQAGFTPSTATLQGVLTGPGLFGVGNLTAGTTYYACFVAVNQAGNTSPPSDFAQATAQSVPAGIPPGSISGLQIQTGTLTAAQLAAEAGILGGQIAQNTITDGNIQAGTITANSIASNVITAQLIEAGTITAGLLEAGIVVSGIIDGTVITGAQFIGDGTGDEWVIYNGTPAANNLLLSESSATMADGHSNQVLEGFTVYGTTGGQYYAYNTGPNGIVYYQQPNMSNWLSGPNAGAQLVATAGTGGSPNWILPSGTGLVPESGITLSSVTSFPTLGTGQSLLYGGASSAGTPQVQQNSGLTGQLPIVQTDTGTYTLGTVGATDTPLSKAWAIPANDAQAGTIYEIEVPLTGTFENQVLTLGAQFDGTGITSLVPVGTVLVSSPGDGVAGTVRLKLTCTATGSGGTYNLDMDGILVDAAGNRGNVPGEASLGGHGSKALSTTASHTVSVAAFWPSSPTSGETISGITSKFTRSGP